MRWFTAALAGAVIGMGVASAIVLGVIVGVVFHDLTGLKGMSISAGFAAMGAVLGLLAEWCTA